MDVVCRTSEFRHTPRCRDEVRRRRCGQGAGTKHRASLSVTVCHCLFRTPGGRHTPSYCCVRHWASPLLRTPSGVPFAACRTETPMVSCGSGSSVSVAKSVPMCVFPPLSAHRVRQQRQQHRRCNLPRL
eukprot:286506-Chlamydomonas_euryale.AAC.1